MKIEIAVTSSQGLTAFQIENANSIKDTAEKLKQIPVKSVGIKVSIPTSEKTPVQIGNFLNSLILKGKSFMFRSLKCSVGQIPAVFNISNTESELTFNFDNLIVLEQESTDASNGEFVMSNCMRIINLVKVASELNVKLSEKKLTRKTWDLITLDGVNPWKKTLTLIGQSVNQQDAEDENDDFYSEE